MDSVHGCLYKTFEKGVSEQTTSNWRLQICWMRCQNRERHVVVLATYFFAIYIRIYSCWRFSATCEILRNLAKLSSRPKQWTTHAGEIQNAVYWEPNHGIWAWGPTCMWLIFESAWEVSGNFHQLLALRFGEWEDQHRLDHVAVQDISLSIRWSWVEHQNATSMTYTDR